MKIKSYSSYYIAYCLFIQHDKFKVILETLDDMFDIGYEVEYDFEIEDTVFILNRTQFTHVNLIMNHFNNIFKIIGE